MSANTLLPIPDQDELEKQFEKIKPPMDRDEALLEASRCLFCHDAPCTIACPSSIDIPMFIRQIASENIKGSAKTIFTQNILGKSCAYVCPTQVLCEGSCVYHHVNEKPIDIGRLQAYATDDAIEKGTRFFEKGKPMGKKVAIIGAGPAGLACAHELTHLGYEAVVFEASDKAGGLNTYGVAPYKYTNADAQQEVDYVQGIGFEIRTGMRVVTEGEPQNSNEVSLAQLEQEYDALFLGLGLGKSRQLGIPGENLTGVVGAAEFIYELREKEQHLSVGSHVVVIGAGNTAIDAAVESAKLGARVTMVYRRSEQEQSAYDFEVAHAKQEGVVFQYLTSPVEILGDASVTGIRCIQNKLDASSGNGKPGIQPVAGSEFDISCDMVILATGQEKQEAFYQAIDGVQLDAGKVSVNEHFQTHHPKYFAGGDCINGGKEVVNAVADGRDAARGIHQMLTGEGQ